MPIDDTLLDDLGKVNILLVDDHPDCLLTLEAVLGCPQYNLVRANSGTEALEQINRQDFAVIVLDVQMPGLDGFETAALMKSRPRTREVPIIFVTAISKEEAFIARGYDVGAVDYLFKPFDPHILRSKVAVFAELFLQKRQIREQSSKLRESERRNRELLLAEVELESLRRYRILADAIPHIVWKAQLSGDFEYFNQEWTDYTGFPFEDSLKAGWKAGVFDEDVAEIEALWPRLPELLSEEQDSYSTEIRVWNAKENSFRWNLLRIVPDRKKNGAIAAWIGTCTDIHDAKQNEERMAFRREIDSLAIRVSNRLLNIDPHQVGEGIREALQELATLLGAQTAYVQIFKRQESDAEALFGWSSSDEVTVRFPILKEQINRLAQTTHLWSTRRLREGKPVVIASVDTLPEDALAEAEFLKSEAIASAVVVPMIYRDELVAILGLHRVDREGRWSDELVRQVQIFGEMFVNTVQRCRTELKALDHADKLARSNADLEQFASVASHDLQEPLRMVASYTQLLEKRYGQSLDAEAKEYIQYTVDSVKRMANLIRDLLSYSRAREANLRYESLESALIIDAALTNLKHAIEESDAKICFGNLPSVCVDRANIVALFQNIIGNAIKYRSNKRPEVTVDAKEQGNYCVFSIKDNGVGIDNRYFSKIFQMFQRLDSKERTGGTGIGLTIAKKIVERHGGKIWLESEPGVGTIFYFTLPLGKEAFKKSA